MKFEECTISGFAGVEQVRVRMAKISDAQEAEQLVEYATNHGVTLCPRGHGCSYGDQAVSGAGIVVDTTPMNRIIAFDQNIGQITLQPGVQLIALLREIVPLGWMVNALPGGLKITVGGAVANNVHGKDSWRCGNFAENVVALRIVTADGRERLVERDIDPAVFACVVGGMGQLGIMTEVTLQLTRIPAPYLQVTTWPIAGLPEMGRFLRELSDEDDYAVGWLDCFARGAGFGRGSAETARWTTSEGKTDNCKIENLLQTHDKILGIFPAAQTWSILRHFFFHGAVRYANAAKYRGAVLRGKSSSVVLFPEFLWMIDKVIPEFNILLTPHGFASLQPLVPMDDKLEGVESILRACQQAHFEPILCSVKRHRADKNPLSFSGDGVSFNIDIPLKGKSEEDVKKFIHGLYRTISDLKGTVYLAKDIYLTRKFLGEMYPNVNKFIEQKKTIDPDNLFMSNMSQRLF